MVDFAAHTGNIIGRLGRPVIITPSGQAARSVTGVFVQSPAMAFDVIDGVFPALRINAQDAVGVVIGTPVLVGSTSYTVTRAQADSEAGDVLLSLDTV